jgi:hypothetical protein
MNQDVLDTYNDLKKEGRPVSLRVVTVTGGDPATGDPGTESYVDHPTYALELETTYAVRISLAKALGSDIAMKDKRLMVAALDTSLAELPEPTTAMKLVDGSTVYNIANAEPLRPGDDIYYYSLQVRGS